jgi:hypothetical protein
MPPPCHAKINIFAFLSISLSFLFVDLTFHLFHPIYLKVNLLGELTPRGSSIGWGPCLMKWRLLIRISHFPSPWDQKTNLSKTKLLEELMLILCGLDE